MNNSSNLRTLLFSVGIGITPLAQADIYSYTDETGAVFVSNHPADNRYLMLLKSPEQYRLLPPAQPMHIPVLTINPVSRPLRFVTLVDKAARENDIEAALVHAVISAESNYNTRSVSRKGAIGLMQLMPATAKRFGVIDRYNPTQNVLGGTRYLKHLMQRFNNDLRLTVAAYNAGENAVTRYGNKIPPYRETTGYVKKVMGFYSQYKMDALALNI